MKKDLAKRLFQQTLKKGAIRSCEFFTSEVLGFENESFHKDIYSILENNRQVLLLAPRSHGKSTIVSINFVLWNLIKNQDVRVILASNTITQAASFLREITQRIENDKQFKSVFGNLKPSPTQLEKWTDTEIIIRREKIQKDPTVSCVGTGGTILTKRADLIICDDILDAENTSTSLQRKKVKEWFLRVLLPCLEPEGRLIVIGTRWNVSDLYGEFLKDKSFQVRKIYKAIQDNGKALWESRWSIQKLKEKKAQMGSLLFNQQYQNIAISDEDAIFKAKWIKHYKPDEVKLEDLDVYGALDPAISQKDTADYSAFITIGAHKKTGKIYVLDVLRGRFTPTELIKRMLDKYEFYKHQRVGIETVAFQRVIKDELDRISQEKRIYVPTTELHPDRDKFRRASAMVPYFENEVIYFKEDQIDLLDELLGFPNAKHDDTVDALGYAVSLVKQEVKGIVMSITDGIDVDTVEF